MVFSCSEMALRCLCTQILLPLQLLALEFYVPSFSTPPPVVNNDHSLQAPITTKLLRINVIH